MLCPPASERLVFSQYFDAMTHDAVLIARYGTEECIGFLVPWAPILLSCCKLARSESQGMMVTFVVDFFDGSTNGVVTSICTKIKRLTIEPRSL